MFLGSYKPSFDIKSRRVALPKKIREFLTTNEIVLSYGFENCIFGFDIKTWEKESAKQLDKSITDKSSRDLRRLFFSTAKFIRLDDQGRFVIPVELFEYTQIKNPVIIGTGDHFEIWNEENWEEYRKGLEGVM